MVNQAEVRRLEALGATRAQRVRTWWVMQVPVGLLFCVVQPQHDDVPGRDSHEWPNAGAAKAAEALRPGGRLAVFWNADEPPADLAQAFSGVYRRVMAGALGARRSSAVSAINGYVMLGAQAAEGMREAGAFTTSEQWRFGWERIYTPDEWLDQVPTQGDHRQFPPAMLEELLAGIDAAINEVGDRFTMPYTTVVVTAARTRG